MGVFSILVPEDQGIVFDPNDCGREHAGFATHLHASRSYSHSKSGYQDARSYLYLESTTCDYCAGTASLSEETIRPVDWTYTRDAWGRTTKRRMETDVLSSEVTNCATGEGLPQAVPWDDTTAALVYDAFGRVVWSRKTEGSETTARYHAHDGRRVIQSREVIDQGEGPFTLQFEEYHWNPSSGQFDKYRRWSHPLESNGLNRYATNLFGAFGNIIASNGGYDNIDPLQGGINNEGDFCEPTITYLASGDAVIEGDLDQACYANPAEVEDDRDWGMTLKHIVDMWTWDRDLGWDDALANYIWRTEWKCTKATGLKLEHHKTPPPKKTHYARNEDYLAISRIIDEKQVDGDTWELTYWGTGSWFELHVAGGIAGGVTAAGAAVPAAISAGGAVSSALTPAVGGLVIATIETASFATGFYVTAVTLGKQKTAEFDVRFRVHCDRDNEDYGIWIEDPQPVHENVNGHGDIYWKGNPRGHSIRNMWAEQEER